MVKKRKDPDVPREFLELVTEYKRQNTKTRLSRGTPASQTKENSPAPADLPSREVSPAPPLGPKAELEWHEDSSEDEVWEDVEIENDDDEFEDVDLSGGQGDVVISFDKPDPIRSKDAIPRQLRISIHYGCLVGLILHTRIRNAWSMLPETRRALINTLPFMVLQELHPPPHIKGYLKTKKLLDGLRHAMSFWRRKFKVSGPGLYCVSWEEINDKSRQIEGPVSRADYVANLKRLEGSTDMMCQGFCALLRSTGLECRLVCSLQPPDFTSPGKQLDRSKPFKPSSYPIYWTEVWDPEERSWISVDPLREYVAQIGRKSGLEPPASDQRNILRYCIAWDHHSKLRDVTRRYSNHYISRTRKKRLPFGGPKWASYYEKLLAKFSSLTFASRDIREIEFLKSREGSEGFPNRIQDFVGHPLYALEQQLKKTELLDPQEPIGRVILKGESVQVYSRRHVRQAHSAQTWYRQGRVVKDGQQPVLSKEVTDRLTKETETVGLYMKDQTTWYVPEPVGADNVVPKSEYRTVDIFRPHMVPAGAIHLNSKYAQRAAKLLRVDYANAVIGVEFSGLRPSSKFGGIVIAKAYEEAVLEVAAELKYLDIEYELKEEELRILTLWRRYIVAIQIRSRIEAMNPDPAAPRGDRAPNASARNASNQDQASAGAVPVAAVQLAEPARLPAQNSHPSVGQSAEVQRKKSVAVPLFDYNIPRPQTFQQLPATQTEAVAGQVVDIIEPEPELISTDDEDFPDVMLDDSADEFL